MRFSVLVRVAVISLAIAILAGIPSVADDGGVYTIAGGAVSLMTSHPSVRMVNEIVTIRMTAKSVKVHCEFLFRNEGKACTVKMGFPEDYASNGEAGSLGRLHGFRSSVDGRPVHCKYKRGKLVSDDTRQSEKQRSWYVKDVAFGAGQTRTVTDDYTTDLGVAASAGETEYQESRSFTYILRTGASWKGPICTARIIVDTTRVPVDRYNLAFSPKGFEIAKGIVSWTLTNVEPKQDISIDLVARYPKLNGKELDSEEWSPYSRVKGVTMAGTGFLEALGAKTECLYAKEGLVVRHNGHTLRLNVGSKTATLDGSRLALQAAPTSKSGGIEQYPVASVVRALGGTAYFSQNEHRLILWLKPASGKPKR